MNQETSQLLARLVKGGKVKDEKEASLLQQLSIKLNAKVPKHTCFLCWLKRKLT